MYPLCTTYLLIPHRIDMNIEITIRICGSKLIYMRYTISYSMLFKADTIAPYCRSWRSEKVKREEKRSVKLPRSLGKNFYVERFLFTVGPLATSFKLGFLDNKLCIIVGIQLRKGGLGDFQLMHCDITIT